MATRIYEVEVIVTVEVDGAEPEARATVDEILQRAWDTDRDSDIELHGWQFELLDGGLVTDITEDER